MFALGLVFLALLAASTAQSGIPRYIQGQWIIPDVSPQYEDADGLAVETIWPAPEAAEVVTEDQMLLTTPEPYIVKEQDEGGESVVWKIVLVAAIVLGAVVGSVSMAYYMCVWRGGRIHYRPQKGGYA